MFRSTKHNMVICTPTKTGSQSLRSTLVKNAGFEDLKPVHSPIWNGDEQRRILMVRNPYKRLESMYKMALRRKSWTTGYQAEVHGDTFEDFLRHHKTVTHTDWSLNYTGYNSLFKPTEIWKLEDINSIMEREFPTLKLAHNNNSKKLYDCPIIWTQEAIDIAAPFVLADCILFGYQPK